MRRLLLLAVLATAACDPLGAPNRLNVSATVDRSHAAVGDTIKVITVATGSAITSVRAVYGDGGSDQSPSDHSLTVRTEFHHAFSKAGTYTIRVTVHDENAGDQVAEIGMFIDPKL